MDYLMPKEEFLSELRAVGLTPATAAWLFNGKSVRSGRRWASHGAPCHIGLLLALMRHYKVTAEQIERLGERWRKSELMEPVPSQEYDETEDYD